MESTGASILPPKPMLAETAPNLNRLGDDGWCAQQKIDGQRMLVTVENGAVKYLNRQGVPKSTGVTSGMQRQFARFSTGLWCFDGEILDSTFWVFDLPAAGKGSCQMQVTPMSTLSWRLEVLQALVEQGLFDDVAVQVLPVAMTTAEKEGLLQRVRDVGGEGVMFKALDAAYVPNRSRHLLKVKFIKDADCYVTRIKVDGKDNLELAVRDDRGEEQLVGMCTALAGDGPNVRPGDVVVVQYAMWSGSRMVQPTRPRLREDKRADECQLNQFPTYSKTVLV